MQHLISGARARLSTLSLCLFSLAGSTAWAQSSTPNLSSQQLALNRAGEALDHVVLTAKKVNGKLGYGFFEQGCVFGVMLHPGTSASEGFTLTAGQSYVFIGGGDKSATNVDVLLTDSSGKIVGKDIERDASPFVLFKPTRTGHYKMALRLASSRGGTAFCAITVLRKGGYDIPLERVAEALVKADAATKLIFRGVNGGRFNQDANTWALYGAVLRPKQSISNDPKHYGAANRGFVGVGDNRIKDLDLLVLNGRQQTLASDTKHGPAAGVAYRTASGMYSIGLVNNNSTGPALVMAILMDLPASLRITTGNQPSSPPTRSNPARSTVPSRGKSPFVGKWSGDWQDDGNKQEGDIEMTVLPGGSLTGNLTNTTVNVTSPIRGYVMANGLFVFGYSYAGQDYVAQGTLKFLNGADGGIDGRVSFRANGVTFGSADFSLDKDD